MRVLLSCTVNSWPLMAWLNHLFEKYNWFTMKLKFLLFCKSLANATSTCVRIKGSFEKNGFGHPRIWFSCIELYQSHGHWKCDAVWIYLENNPVPGDQVVPGF